MKTRFGIKSMIEIKFILGDCLERLKELPNNSVDSIVTDPPAGISFMGREWDHDKGGRDNWIKWMSEVATECKRVLKPGGHAFVWSIPRTSHWTGMAWKNAGFQPRDVVAHVFGSGFPKSANVQKYLQKIGSMRADDFSGWGTSLKPAREDWWLMRKPLEKGLSVAENCLKWKCGGINIDESRVEHDEPIKMMKAQSGGDKIYGQSGRRIDMPELKENGRFPANLIHDNSEEVRGCFPETGISKGGNAGVLNNKVYGKYGTEKNNDGCGFGDSGNASRFFKSIIYQAKASKSERNLGCEGLEDKERIDYGGFHSEKGLIENNRNPENRLPMKNRHPCVKSIALMEYLIKMITPQNGTVLDPFMGSGSTGVACKKNSFSFIGIEKEQEYFEIAENRINNWKEESEIPDEQQTLF